MINNNNDNNNNKNNNNNTNNNFQNALNNALNYQTIETHPERISKLKPYINEYNWEVIDYPAGSKEWQKFEENNETIAFNVLYTPYNIETKNIAYKSKYNNKRKEASSFINGY